jgi:hypothetical protein
MNFKATVSTVSKMSKEIPTHLIILRRKFVQTFLNNVVTVEIFDESHYMEAES